MSRRDPASILEVYSPDRRRLNGSEADGSPFIDGRSPETLNGADEDARAVEVRAKLAERHVREAARLASGIPWQRVPFGTICRSPPA
jgi:hypothetical protein